MLVACRLAGLSALEAYYAGVRVGAQCEAGASSGNPLRFPALPLTQSWRECWPDRRKAGRSLIRPPSAASCPSSGAGQERRGTSLRQRRRAKSRSAGAQRSTGAVKL